MLSSRCWHRWNTGLEFCRLGSRRISEHTHRKLNIRRTYVQRNIKFVICMIKYPLTKMCNEKEHRLLRIHNYHANLYILWGPELTKVKAASSESRSVRIVRTKDLKLGVWQQIHVVPWAFPENEVRKCSVNRLRCALSSCSMFSDAQRVLHI